MKSTVWIIIITLAAVLLVCDLLLVDWMTRYACDSKSPKMPAFLSQGLLGRKAKAVNLQSPSRKRAEQLRNLAVEKVTITNREGLRLTGHWYRCEQPKRMILAGHGWRSSWDYDFNGQYEFLHDMGCSILFIEQRCHGESEGRYYYHGKKERFDYVDWLQYMENETPGDLPIYIFGLSMGAAAAIMATTAGISSRVKGVIADSAYTSVRDIGFQTIGNIGLPTGFFYFQVKIDYRLRLGMADNAYTTVDAIRENTEIPILFISGTEDRLATVTMEKELFAMCKAPKMQLIAEGAGHMKSYYVEPDKYMEIVKRFIAMTESSEQAEAL